MNWFESAKQLLAKWKEEQISSRLFNDRFTPRAQQVFALARKEADRLNHNYVGTEHLLLGIIKLGQGSAMIVLSKMNLNFEAVCKAVENQICPEIESKNQKSLSIPYTLRVRRVLEIAQKEATALNHTYIGTEHILLGLLSEGEGVAGRVLKSFNIEFEQTRKEILKELTPNFSQPDEGQENK